jgi:hypothetical protein
MAHLKPLYKSPPLQNWPQCKQYVVKQEPTLLVTVVLFITSISAAQHMCAPHSVLMRVPNC